MVEVASGGEIGKLELAESCMGGKLKVLLRRLCGVFLLLYAYMCGCLVVVDER